MASFDGSRNDLTYLQKRNQKLYEEMLQSGALKPRLTISKLIALALALLIHGVTLYFALVCVWNLINGIVWIRPGFGSAACTQLGS